MRIGLFGGTFNPVHNGHLLIAEAARETYKLDKIVFIPAGLPPHKKAPRTSPKHRAAQLRLALRGNPSFTFSAWEMNAGRVVYTYETVEHFKRLWPKASLYFLMGEDARKSFPRWREPRRIRAVCRPIAADRLAPFASHDIRARVRKGQSIRYLVPESVERYIRQHRLYKRPE